MNPETRRITTGEARLLLSVLGYRRAYGFLGEGGEDAAGRLVRLTRNGVLKQEGDKLAIQQPYREWMEQWGRADRALLVENGEDGSPVACLYPGERGLLACAPCRGNPEILRLSLTPPAGLADWLEEDCGFPSWEERAVPQRQQAPPLTEAEEQLLRDGEFEGAEGCLYAISCVKTAGGGLENRLLAMQRPLCRELVAGGSGGGARYPYDRAALEQVISIWLGGI